MALASEARPTQPEPPVTPQQIQHDHNVRYHDDIMTMDLTGRLKHDALHFSKYVGRWFENGINKNAASRKTVIDTALMAVGAASTLKINLEDIWTDPTIPPLRRKDIIRNLAIPMGRLASAVEKIDHLESGGPSMHQAVRDIIRWVIGASKYYQIPDLHAAMEAHRETIRDSRFHIRKKPIL